MCVCVLFLWFLWEIIIFNILAYYYYYYYYFILFFGVEGQIGKETKDSGESQLGPAHISETLDTAIKTKHKY